MLSPGSAFDFRAALARELNAALQELDECSAPGKAVHRCRVRLKRARALARLGQPVAPGLAALFDDTAAAAIRRLGPARDDCVLADTARLLAHTASARSAAALLAAADSIEANISIATDRDIGVVRSNLRDLSALAQVWPEPSAEQLRTAAAHLIERARRARRRGRWTKDALVRHRWRKREKDRLYAALLLGDAWPAPRQRRRSAALGHILGLERDAHLLMARISHSTIAAGGPEGATRARKLLRRHIGRLVRRADRLGEKLQDRGA